MLNDRHIIPVMVNCHTKKPKLFQDLCGLCCISSRRGLRADLSGKLPNKDKRAY